ncbi:Gfo/Idh/MocA family oxidoreductase [Bradyrhizobium sp. LVM 105]|uniref:Gfo/Idh/MocA family oxidoreductase n=1 Tax=Bradyrhizobium sp. LVM 105 TaxID=2341115 RepID=UPI00196A463C
MAISGRAESADLSTFVEGRQLEDNAHILLRFEGNTRGMLWASQVAVGCENGLQLRVYGDKAGLAWRQETPNQMWFTEFGRPKQLLTRAGAIAGDAPPIQVRLPSGHPEGYLEAFATLYSEFAQLIRSGDVACPDLPSLADGAEGMEFIAAAVRSSNNKSMWTSP